MDPARRLATYEDLLALPEGSKGEILAGVLTTPPAPLPRHSRAQGALRRFIGGPYDDDDGRGGPGGWWILLEVDVALGRHDVVRPDLCGWRRENLVEPWDARPIEVRPDWVCEILSPSNEAHDRVAKRKLYARHGVPFYWIVDPFERTLEAYRLHQGTWSDVGAFDDTAVVKIPPFDAIELELAVLFPPKPAK
jgi:Uma2 family endonuclease